MATDSAETLPSESIQQQILVSEQVTAPEGFQNAISSNIPTTIQTIPQQNGEIATISTSTLAETMATSEAIMATESISVGTQEASSSLSAQEIVDSIPQVQEHDSVPGSQQSLVISAENVAIGTSASLDASPHPQIASNYPWAARLHDCELIGDSYRGYVMNEVELDLILTLHKQHTSSCWGTRQSPSSAKPSIRLMWKSQYVPYDGIPFLNTGRRATVMECQYGPRRKGAVNKKQPDYNEHGSPVKKHRPTCPARIYIKKVRKFPEFRIDPTLDAKHVRQAQERALTALRLAGVDIGGEERYYVQLPLPLAHEYHDIDDIPMDPEESAESQGQRLNPEVMNKIRELVARGVSGIYTVKHCLKVFVEKELFANVEAPARHNRSYFPTIIDIQNHIHQAQMALATGSLMPLPPLTNFPQSYLQLKEKTRKRKHTPEKLSQSSQTSTETITSIQRQYSSARMTSQDQEQLLHQTSRENYHGSEQAHQLGIIQGTDGQATEVDLSNQHQILITQGSGSGRDEGQVVIVVNASSFFSGQSDSDTPATLSLTIPASQVASLSHASLHSSAGAQAVTLIPSQTDAPPQTSGTATTSPQTVTFIPQVAENSRSAVAFLTTQQSDNTSQVPVSAAYLATHGQTSNILSMLDSALQASSPGSAGPIIRVGSSAGAVPATDSSQSTDAISGHVVATQAAVDAVLSAAKEESKQTRSGEESVEGEPQEKRQALEVDLSSLVKEAVFDGQQVEGVISEAQEKSSVEGEQPGMVSIPVPSSQQQSDNTQFTGLSQANEEGNFISMATTRPVVMVPESVLQSVQEGGQTVILEDGENKLHVGVRDSEHCTGTQQMSVELQHTESAYENNDASPQIPVVMETVQRVSVAMETNDVVPAPVTTSQDLGVSIETHSEHPKQQATTHENSLKVTEEEQRLQDYNIPASCAAQSSGTDPISVSLLFATSQQQLPVDEPAVTTHTDTVSAVNNTPAVFSQ